MRKLQATKFKQVGREHYLSSASFKVIISDCAVCGCFFDITVAIPHNNAAVYCKPEQMIRKKYKEQDAKNKSLLFGRTVPVRNNAATVILHLLHGAVAAMCDDFL